MDPFLVDNSGQSNEEIKYIQPLVIIPMAGIFDADLAA